MLRHNLEYFLGFIEVEKSLPPQSQPAHRKEHGRPNGVYPLVYGSASLDQTLKGSQGYQRRDLVALNTKR